MIIYGFAAYRMLCCCLPNMRNQMTDHAKPRLLLLLLLSLLKQLRFNRFYSFFSVVVFESNDCLSFRYSNASKLQFMLIYATNSHPLINGSALFGLYIYIVCWLNWLGLPLIYQISCTFTFHVRVLSSHLERHTNAAVFRSDSKWKLWIGTKWQTHFERMK